MEKNIFKKAACIAGAVVITLTMTTAFFGCNSDSEETAPTVQEKPEAFKDALRSLAKAQRESCQILFGAMQTRALDDPLREGPDSAAIAAAITRADSILTAAFGSTLSTIDLTADLTPVQLNALNITPREAELYAADPYAFLDYAETAKTPEFNRIYRSVLNGTSTIPTVENVINNSNLTMTEQIGLVVAVTTAEEAQLLTDMCYQVALTPAEQKCMDNFTFAQGLCTAKYFGEVLIDIAVTIISEGTLTIWTAGDVAAATAIFFVCVEENKSNFYECMRKARGK